MAQGMMGGSDRMMDAGHGMMMGGSHGMMGDGMMEGVGAFLFGYLLLDALLIFVVVAGAIVLVRALWKPQHQESRVNHAAGSAPALEILEQRYAGGEIDDEELDRRRRALGRTP